MDHVARLRHAQALVEGGQFRAALPNIQKLLAKTDDQTIQVELLSALSKCGTDAAELWPTLREFAASPHTDVSLEAMCAMVSIDRSKALRELPGFLTHDITHVRWNAVFTLEEFGPQAAGALPQFQRLLLGDPDKDVRWVAAGAISKVCAHPDEASELLAPGLSDPVEQVRIYVAAEYIQFRPDNATARRILIAGVSNENFYTQCCAIRGLGYVAGEAEAAQAIRLISEVVPKREFAGSNDTIASLARLGRQAPNELIKLLDSDSNRTIAHAAGAIEELGSEARQYIGELLRALRRVRALPPLKPRQPPWDYRDLAANSLLIALGKLATHGNKELLPVLLEALDNDNELVREAAAKGLGKIGDANDTVRKSLAACVNDSYETVRTAAAESLRLLFGSISPE